MSGAATDVAGALGRASVYRLLGRAFTVPTAAVLAELERGAATAAAAPGTPPAVAARLGELAAAASAGDPAALAEEFVRLFHRQARCAPYEGAYGTAPQMAGKGVLLADVAGFYAAFGFGPASPAETEDHVGAELEFMSLLALKEAWALAEGHDDGLAVVRAAQRAFLADHLGRWAGAFAGDLAAASPSPYYAAAAGLLERWMAVELEAFGVSAPRAARLATTSEEAAPLACPMAAPEPAPIEE